MYGYCGVKGDEHRCEDYYAIEVIVLQISTIADLLKGEGGDKCNRGKMQQSK